MTAYPELEDAKASWRHQPPTKCLSGKAILVAGAEEVAVVDASKGGHPNWLDMGRYSWKEPQRLGDQWFLT